MRLYQVESCVDRDKTSEAFILDRLVYFDTGQNGSCVQFWCTTSPSERICPSPFF